MELRSIPRPRIISDDIHKFYERYCGNHITMLHNLQERGDIYYDLEHIASLVYLALDNPGSSDEVLQRLIGRYATLVKDIAREDTAERR